ncbi:MAG: Ig-like domain-containing protein [Gemmatimonadales bacterium]
MANWRVVATLGVGGALAACFGDLANQTDTDSPILAITSPRHADTVSGLVSIQADALDSGGIDVVKFFIDGTLLTTDLRAPYQTVWNTNSATKGAHVIRVEATDLVGNSSTESIAVIVGSGTN